MYYIAACVWACAWSVWWGHLFMVPFCLRWHIFSGYRTGRRMEMLTHSSSEHSKLGHPAIPIKA